MTPAPRGMLRVDSVKAEAGVLRGRLAWVGSRFDGPLRVRLSRASSTSTVDVEADTFRIAGATPGDYELRTLMWGQHPRIDSVRVPSRGLSVLLPFAWMGQLDGCGGNNVTTVRTEDPGRR